MDVLKLFFLALLFLNTNVYANEDSLRIMSATDIEQITDLVNKELKSSSLSSERRFTLLFNLAEDLRQFRFNTQAIKYYEEAIASKANSNKFGAYLGLINLKIQEGDSKQALVHISEAKTYLKKHPKFNDKESIKFLDGLAYGFDESAKEMPKGFLNTYAVDERIKTLIISQKYAQALALYEPKVIKISNDQHDIITYDLLNLKVNPQTSAPLYCEKSYNLNPDAYTYTAILCGLLKNQTSEKALTRATLYFTEDNTSVKYLFDLYKEIK